MSEKQAPAPPNADPQARAEAEADIAEVLVQTEAGLEGIAQAAAAAIEGNAGEAGRRQETQPGQSNEKAAHHHGEHAQRPHLADRHTPDSFYREHHVGHHHAEHLDVPPPAYNDTYGHINSESDGLGTRARIASDGRVDIRIHQKNKKLSNLLVPALRSQVAIAGNESPLPPPYIPPSLGGRPDQVPPPPLNVVIHVVGSRGDVQPFVALGQVLKERYGHRVRLATHPVFKSFVEENGLEFFSISGDPSELMAFMVKNPGLMPGFDTLRNGDVGKKRQNIADMVKGCWRSCYESGDGTGVEANDDRMGELGNQERENMINETFAAGRPFVADAIIANPPSFAHIHCAERLGIPLHMMFTMPWSPTQAFPHPLANITSSDADATMTNFMSYALVDMMTWQGLGDVINRFRVHSLGLEPLSLMWAPGMLARLRIPYTYCWSPALIPKPKDWGNHITISGFYFLNLASNYTPAPDLQAFLDAGPPPVYIGFGSIVLDDPDGMTKLIFDAVKRTGQRALVSKGWGGFGADQIGIPDGVFMLGNVPHDWLFKNVSCVVHHGGAGTTAAGIACGRPTVVVPFFGDQPFWGAMVARAGAGPPPVPHKQLTAEKLAESILEALKPASLERAAELSAKISHEKGGEEGAQYFHQMLDVDKMRCVLLPDRPAVWRVKRTQVRLSACAAFLLSDAKVLSFEDLKMYRPREYEVDEGPWDPITGGASALVGTMGSLMMGVADLPVETLKALKIHPKKKTSDTEGSESRPTTAHSRKESGTSNNLSRLTSRTSLGTTPSRTSLTTSDTVGDSHGVGSGSTSPLIGAETTSPTEYTPMSSPALHPEDTRTSRLDTHMSSMAQALRRSDGDHRPSSRGSCRSRSGSRSRATSHGPKPDIVDTAMGTGKGISKIVGAGLKSPLDFTMGLAKGFHNAPKLYGDDTVRQVDKVTDFKSGVRTAAKQFGLGFYDGITGLVTQPISGARKEGAVGLMKGFGKGIAGVALKPGAAIYGIPGYAMQGFYKEIQKHFGSSVENYIIASRTAQGFEEMQTLTEDEKSETVALWVALRHDIKKKRNPGEESLESVQKIMKEKRQKRKDTLDKYKSRINGMRSKSGIEAGSEGDRLTSDRKSSYASSSRTATNDLPGLHLTRPSHTMSGRTNSQQSGIPLIMTPSGQTERDAVPGYYDDSGAVEDRGPIQLKSYSDAGGSETDPDDLEEAIKLSIQETSTGNSKEDMAIANAIRASLSELGLQEKHVLHHAGHEDEEDALQKAMLASVADAGAEADDNKDLELALQKSMTEQKAGPEDEDHVYKKALEESEKADKEDQEKRNREDEIVMEFIKKQSLAEEEMRRQRLQGRPQSQTRGMEVGESSGSGSAAAATSSSLAPEQTSNTDKGKRRSFDVAPDPPASVPEEYYAHGALTGENKPHGSLPPRMTDDGDAPPSYQDAEGERFEDVMERHTQAGAEDGMRGAGSGEARK
ncbi:glycosyltransferase family 1 protein [Aulographum hederae CBS 113979]|uniref:Glycosyltransferase family 1 protein n=1 Tax=Aulographum hederae CBS 113979 TaxID=1176131 RepID=A0A6G1H6S7_9PEZI|nr:glycosyltransferase family 1 protein [Aulographum hederae CBS 113979]